MKSVRSLLALAILSVACNGTSYKPAPMDAPDRSSEQQKNLASCPSWSGRFVGKKGEKKIIQMEYDKRRAIIFHDGPDTTWVVDGKPHPITGNRLASYSAICTPGVGVDGNPTAATSGGVDIDAFEGGKRIFAVTYAPVDQGFSYSRKNPDGSDAEPSDTYAPVTK